MQSSEPRKTQILRSHYAAHDGWLGLFAYQILRAGHIRTGPDHAIDRKDVPGHEFLFCLKGRGCVTFEGRSFDVGPSQLVWLPVREPHAHRPDPDDPWELLWLRLDSPNLSRLMTVLAVHSDPVFHFNQPEEIRALFEDALSYLSTASLASQACCDRVVAKLIEYLLESRGSRLLEPEVSSHKGLGRLMAQIHIHYNDHWNIEKLAAECHVSKSHLFRLFRSAFNKTPLNWLRDYRIAQAKRLLIETSDSVTVIANRVGYSDSLYFSRDFKKRTGQSPRTFRASEHW